MRIPVPSYIALIVLCTGCKAFKSLSSRDTSASQSSRQPKNEKNIAFLDDISVTPGASNEKKAPVAVKKPARNNKPVKSVADKTNNTESPAKADPANTAMLRLKYAPILGVGPEQLTNTLLLQTVDQWWGTRYCYGGNTGDCIDCSAFTQLILTTVYNTHIPRVAQDQYDSSERIKESNLAEGDLVFFHTTGRGKSITHVGVYITNNKFAHASTSEGVVITDLDDPYWKQRYRGAGRVIY